MASDFSWGPKDTELELALADYRKAFGETTGTTLLAQAAEADDSYGKKKLTDAQKQQRMQEAIIWARRESEIENDEIVRLRAVVGTVSEASYEGAYVLSSMLLAAAVGRADLLTRVNTALLAGNAAVDFQQWEAAKTAYVDCLESLRLVLLFFEADEAQVRRIESGILHSWSQIREHLDESGDILDLPDDARAYETMLKQVVWNTDFGENNRGHLPQADAMARLVIGLEHFLEVQNGDSLQLAKAWEASRASLVIPDEEHVEFGQSRCMTTCADAFLETGNYEAAVSLYAALSDSVTDSNEVGLSHVLINRAIALYQLGRTQEAQALFATIDAATLENLAGFIVTLRAEWSRYVATRYILNVDGATDFEETSKLVEEAIREIARIMIQSASGRIGYLRELFVGQISRDVAGILALDQYFSN
jgi:tetratricopeptide (TPR) repeat protein